LLDEPNPNDLRQGVFCCLISERGEVLLERKPDDHPLVPGEYVFPGGRVEPGETDLQALRRELDEECGIREDLELLIVHDNSVYDAPGGQRFAVRIFYASNWSGRYNTLPGIPIEALMIEDARARLKGYRREALDTSLSLRATMARTSKGQL
jgi:mutator protein MutT